MSKFALSIGLPKSRFDGSFQFDVAFQKKYADSLIPQLQQMGSVLQPYVEVDMDVAAEYKFYTFRAPRTANKVTERFGDTPVNHQQYSRRRLQLSMFDDGDLIDDFDKLKAATDPAGAIQEEMRYAFGRAKDSCIITAADATVYAGKEGTEQVTLPAKQVMSSSLGSTGATGLNTTKIRRANRLFGAASIPATEARYCALTAAQIEDLLASTEVTSSDYNSVKALVNGEVNSFCGFTFVQTELLETNSSNERKVIFFTKKSFTLAIGKDIAAEIYKRGDKKMNTQVYTKMFIGCVRMDENRVVIAPCKETALA